VLKGGPTEWNTPVWKHDLDKGLLYVAAQGLAIIFQSALSMLVVARLNRILPSP
jgi:hypothetical protein